jgi:hypothetical protein
MTLPQRLLHAMTDPRARCGCNHLCAIDGTAASFRRGHGRSDALRPRMSDHKPERGRTAFIDGGLAAAPDARPGDADSP